MIEYVDQASLKRLESDLAKIARITNRTMLETLRQQGGLFAKDAMKLTPPFNASGGIKDSYPKQRRTGLKAVEHDVDLVFRHVEDYWVLNQKWSTTHGDIGQQIRNAVKKNNWHLAEYLLNRIRLFPKAVVPDATVELHRRNFNKDFRVRGKKYAVKNKASIGRVKLALQKQVGIAKAGWLDAFDKYGRDLGDVPTWIKKHKGTFTGVASETGSEEKPVITIANTVPYVQDRAPVIMPILWKVRAQAIQSNRKALERYEAKKLREAGIVSTTTA